MLAFNIRRISIDGTISTSATKFLLSNIDIHASRMITRCITLVHTYTPTHGHLSSSGVAVTLYPARPGSSNDEALDYCINNTTNSAVSRQSPSRARELSSAARFSGGSNWNRYHIVRSIRPAFGHECVYTAFGVAARHSFSAGPFKTVKTTARPIRHSMMFTSRPLDAPNTIAGQS